MRVIPKRTKVRMELFRGVEVMDVIVGASGILITLSFIVSNLPARFIFAGIMMLLTVCLVFPLGDDKGYLLVLYALRYLGRPRHFYKRGTGEEKEYTWKSPWDNYAGMIRSVRGVNGGFHIAMKPEEITLLDVVEVMEGPLSIVDCVSAPKRCKLSENCAPREVWCKLNDDIRGLMGGISLADILATYEKQNAKDGSMDYCI